MSRAKRFIHVFAAVAVLVMCIFVQPAYAADSGSQEMYRLYNPNSGEHFYTANVAERDHLTSLGWRYEGVGWIAPASSDTPVYRLYNPNAGDHHYTTSAPERDNLIRVGWRYEGRGWYSSDAKTVPLYRQYNPNAHAGAHNFTASRSENDNLVRVGWRAEGIGWYGINQQASGGSGQNPSSGSGGAGQAGQTGQSSSERTYEWNGWTITLHSVSIVPQEYSGDEIQLRATLRNNSGKSDYSPFYFQYVYQNKVSIATGLSAKNYMDDRLQPGGQSEMVYHSYLPSSNVTYNKTDPVTITLTASGYIDESTHQYKTFDDLEIEMPLT